MAASKASDSDMKRLTIVGAGWAGLAAAVTAIQAGWQVTLYEASATAGGRARSLPNHYADLPLDNGQHILIGGYRDTLALMRTVGTAPETMLHRIPLDLRFANGEGLQLPDWPAPLNILAGLLGAYGWTWQDKIGLLRTAATWQLHGFVCPAHWSVHDLNAHHHLSPRVVQQLIEPLCLSALNTPMHRASAAVFLRVLGDALLGGKGSSDLLIPTQDLGQVLPDACLSWLTQRGANIHLHQRVGPDALASWLENTETTVILACPAWEAARLAAPSNSAWAHRAADLKHEAIATVYLHCTDAQFKNLPRPMMALCSNAQSPAQYVFDRGAFTQQAGLLAAVVSACTLDKEEVSRQVQTQVATQLGLTNLHVLQTVVEKRATFACTPGLRRPTPQIASRLWACGDYIEGPYPSTLEGAVRSGQQVVTQLG